MDSLEPILNEGRGKNWGIHYWSHTHTVEATHPTSKQRSIETNHTKNISLTCCSLAMTVDEKPLPFTLNSTIKYSPEGQQNGSSLHNRFYVTDVGIDHEGQVKDGLKIGVKASVEKGTPLVFTGADFQLIEKSGNNRSRYYRVLNYSWFLHLFSASSTDRCPEGWEEDSSTKFCKGNPFLKSFLFSNSTRLTFAGWAQWWQHSPSIPLM